MCIEYFNGDLIQCEEILIFNLMAHIYVFHTKIDKIRAHTGSDEEVVGGDIAGEQQMALMSG